MLLYGIKRFAKTALLWNLVNFATNGLELPGEGGRYSLFLGPELDRVLILLITSSIKTLSSEIS
jgi:hypothetical protein